MAAELSEWLGATVRPIRAVQGRKQRDRRRPESKHGVNASLGATRAEKASVHPAAEDRANNGKGSAGNND